MRDLYQREGSLIKKPTEKGDSSRQGDKEVRWRVYRESVLEMCECLCREVSVGG